MDDRESSQQHDMPFPCNSQDFSIQRLPDPDQTEQSPVSSPPPPNRSSIAVVEPLPRLAIHSLQLNNFKSYGGTVRVGPFHKNFSAVVGPNGSGKSNVIDAMLFVFGRPAKHLRHSKLSELLHNSATYPNVQSATVSVFFHDILDTGDNDDDFTVLPNSEFSVARTAYRNNTSKYFLDKREVKRKDVVDLLKSKGVDLDNNRFLILQGEVEQIALMKPKSINAHDTGLLEYLEDIIGSHRHIEKIEQSSSAVETLNEERSHKLNRVKVAERERDALESTKRDAEDYLDKERAMLNKKIKLNKSQQYDSTVTLKEHSEEHSKAETKVDGFRNEVKEKETMVSSLEATFKETQKQESTAVKDLNESKESYAAFERKDIKLREDMKALKTKHKKLKGVIERERARADENKGKADQFLHDKEAAEGGISKAESDLKLAQEKFDKTRDEVKERTQPVREQLEKKQEKLLPFSEAINKARKDLQVNQSNLKLLDERLAAPQKNLDEAKQNLEIINGELGEASQRLRNIQSECNENKSVASECNREYTSRQARVQEMSTSYSSMRRRVEEARAAKEFSSTRSRLHNAVLSASSGGRLRGVVGRLGDLASVDEHFATAVSAAAGANLDCIVVHTAENAQACIQFLRRENLGRATFIILEKVQYLRSPIESWSRSDRRHDGRRLFDFLKIPNPQNETAVYYALRDTLVADSLEEARRIAFKPTRQNRVVTLNGELIESTGAMTGGGRGPTKYKLGTGSNGEEEMDPDSFRRLCADMQKLKDEIHQEHNAIENLDQKRRSADSQIETLEVQLSKCKVEVSSLESRARNMENNTLPNLKKVCEEANTRICSGTCEDSKKRNDAQKAVNECGKQLDQAKAACKDIEKDISQLQDEILAAGGSELEKRKVELEECRKKVSNLQSEVSTASSRSLAAKKAAEKAEIAVETAVAEQERIEKDLAEAKEASEAMLDDAEKVAEKIEEAEKVHTEWADKLREVEAEYANVKGSLKSLRRKEVSLIEAAEALRRLVDQDIYHLGALKKEEKNLSSKLKRSSMMGIAPVIETNTDNDDIEEDNAKNKDDTDEDMEICDNQAGKEDRKVGEENEKDADMSSHEMSSLDQKKLEAEIGVLEGELASMSPNLSAIADYASKDREYRGQVGELDNVTKHRDEARHECERLRKARLDEFMNGFSTITLKLKELYQMITLGGDAELELVDSLDPFSEGIVFSVRPPKKSWKNICNLSGGEKTLSSLALVFALHHFKPTPLYFLDEIDAALDYKNVSIVGNYVKERTKDAQFIIISLRNNMFELADRLVGIYKTHHTTKSVTINPRAFVMPQIDTTQVTQVTQLTQSSKA